MSENNHYPEAALAIIQKKAPNFTPKLFIVCGSGLGPIANAITDSITIAYSELPGFPECSVRGHEGTLVLGLIEGVPIACLTGRIHFYEGHDNTSMRTIIRTMKLLGAEIMFATNSSGSLRESVRPGELVILKDHINFQFRNPLVGKNDDHFGPRFVAMEDAYDPELREKIAEVGHELGYNMTEGVYFGVLGPSFETPAEINAYRILGAEVIGMSTVADVLVARHCGLKVAVVSVITNMAAGMSAGNLSHDETLSGAKKATADLIQLIIKFIGRHYGP